MDDNKKINVWFRLGVSVDMTKDELDKLVKDNDQTRIRQLIKERKFSIHGDTYIPEPILMDINNYNSTDYETDEIDIDTDNLED